MAKKVHKPIVTKERPLKKGEKKKVVKKCCGQK